VILNSCFRNLFLIAAVAISLNAANGQDLEIKENSDVDPMKLLASVNGEEVTQAQLEFYFVQYMNYYGNELAPEDIKARRAQITQQSFDNAVKGALIRSLGKERNLTPTNEEIEAARKNIHTVIGCETPEQLDQVLKSSGIPESELRIFIETNLINLKLIDAYNQDNPTTVTTSMARIFYNRNPELHKRPAQAHVRHIVFDTAGLSAEEKAKKYEKAEAALKRLKEGEDFSKVAAEFSEGPNATKGGDLGILKAGNIEPDFEKAIFQVDNGTISGIVETKYGYHIIRVDDKKPAEDMSFERVKDVLIPQMAYQLQKQKYQDWLLLQLEDAELTLER
jgi:peptidyl-prolyl cis-trans isomerase C